jgi:hypothetical protein
MPALDSHLPPGSRSRQTAIPQRTDGLGRARTNLVDNIRRRTHDVGTQRPLIYAAEIHIAHGPAKHSPVAPRAGPVRPD